MYNLIKVRDSKPFTKYFLLNTGSEYFLEMQTVFFSFQHNEYDIDFFKIYST